MNECIEGLENFPPSLTGCVLTIGNFDGVHLGHQRILRTARTLADQAGTRVVAMTFEPPPDLVLHPADVPQRITPPDEKLRLLRACGADTVVRIASTRDFLSTTAQEFIEQVILGRFAPSHMVEGPNFFFGRGRAGNVQLLAQVGRFQMHVVEPVMMELADGLQRVSSSLVRSLIAAGDVSAAHRCLGRPFTLMGPVVRGQGRGRTLSFPTANIEPGNQIVPCDGIYAGQALVEDQAFTAAISIGVNPTVGPVPRAIEAFLVDATCDLYGRRIAVRFLDRLRDQQKFDSVETLRAQIEKDVERVRQIVQ